MIGVNSIDKPSTNTILQMFEPTTLPHEEQTIETKEVNSTINNEQNNNEDV